MFGIHGARFIILCSFLLHRTPLPFSLAGSHSLRLEASAETTPPLRSSLWPSPSSLLSLLLFQGSSPACSFPRNLTYLHHGPSVLHGQIYFFCSSHGPTNSLRAGIAFSHFCFPAGALWMFPDPNLVNNFFTQGHKDLPYSCLEH